MSDEIRSTYDKYIGKLFAPEDDVLIWIKEQINQSDMPPISVKSHDGYLLSWLMKLIAAKSVVEIGTLGGYSGTWIARALPDDGKLYTLELEEKHAQVAQAAFDKAGVSDKVEILLGNAHETIKQLSGQHPFDFVFIDAEKGGYLDYLNWAIENLRSGGIVTAHNVYRNGRVMNPTSDDDKALAAFNQAIANHPQLESLIIPLGDGMAAGMKK